MKFRNNVLKILPYLASFLAGLIFWLVGLELSGDIRSLFISLAAAFFAIPLIYLFYQKAHNLSQKKLNKEMFDYAKMQIDREVLSIINQLRKAIYPIEDRNLSPASVNKFLSLKKDNLKEILNRNEYLGFQIFKKWEVTEENLHEVLKNSYMLKSLENEQIISIISIIKCLRNLGSVQKIEELYTRTDKIATSYKVKHGKELNKENVKFPDRYLLLRSLGENKYLVADFGDFPLYNANKLLQVFIVNEDLLEAYISAILSLINEINIWVDLTGGEFVVDTRTFRLGYKVTVDN